MLHLLLEIAYEKEQDKLEYLMQEMVSEDENSLFGDDTLSDEYHAESSDEGSASSTFSIGRPKRHKK